MARHTGPLPPEKRQQIIDQYTKKPKKGELRPTVDEVAAAVGVGRDKVNTVLRDAGKLRGGGRQSSSAMCVCGERGGKHKSWCTPQTRGGG